MSKFNWTSDFSVENSAVDIHHEALFAIVRELGGTQPIPELFAVILDRLSELATDHFAREEALMAAIRFPELDEHIKSHREFDDFLNDARERFRANSNDRAQMCRDIREFCENWLTQHILNEDMRYRDYIMTKN